LSALREQDKYELPDGFPCDVLPEETGA